MAPVTFTYFDIRGRGFVSRALLTLADAEFEDKRVSFADWPQLKPQTPYGQVPVYEEGDLKVTQSNAIHRYLAEKHGFFGEDAVEKVRIDEAYEIINDLFQAGVKAHFIEKTDESKADFLTNVVPKYVAQFKTLLEKNGNNGFVVGDKLSLADLQAFHAFNNWVRPLSPAAIGDAQAYLDQLRKGNEKFAAFLKNGITAVTLPPFIDFASKPEEFAGEFDN